jgi:hypothetical protein
MNKSIIGIVIGLMIATSTVYFVESAEEFGEEDMAKGTFFLIAAITYILIAIWGIFASFRLPVIKNNPLIVITLVGTVGLMALYAVTRTDMALFFGMEVGKIGHLGIVSKILQAGIVLGLIITLIQSKKEAGIKSKQN